MVFNTFDRGVLEQLFEQSVSGMKKNVEVARDEMFKNVLNDKDGMDLALGISLGMIHTSFTVGFKQRNGRYLNSEETTELMTITKDHLPKLKEAIFQCG